MIELMLHDSAEHIKKRVVGLALALDLLPEPRIGKLSNQLDEPLVRFLQLVDRVSPRRLAGILYRGEILAIGKIDHRSRPPAPDRIVPGGDVQDQFPDG